MIFLFTGSSGERFGYTDHWDNEGVFHYYGEGQRGDMQFNGGNAAVRDHVASGKDLYLFATLGKGAPVRYVGQVVYADHDVVPNSLDVDQRPRDAIVFQLLPLEAASDSPSKDGEETEPVDATGKPVPKGWYWQASMAQLHAAALTAPQVGMKSQLSRRNVHHRSEAVSVYVQRRAEGKCEGCGAPAPFKTAAGRLYLEPHHTERLSDGGPDKPNAVIAVCPTCHRRAHYSADAKAFNGQLKTLAAKLGP